MNNSTKNTKGLNRFLTANGWLIPAVIGVFSVEKLQSYLIENILYFAILIAVYEILAIYWCFIQIEESDEVDSDDEIGRKMYRESTEIRFADLNDGPGMDKVYSEWFPDQLSIDNDEYNLIQDREKFIRVALDHYKNGNHLEKILSGYYSIFPIKIELYDKLREGSLDEKDIKSSDVLDFSDLNAKVLYIPEICESKRSNVGVILLRDMMRYIVKILDNHPNIECIATWPYTKIGKKLSKELKMKPAKGRRFFQKIHYISNASAKSLPRPSGEFKDKYAIKY